MKIAFQIDAVPQARPRFYHGVAVDPPKSRQFKAKLKSMAQECATHFFSGAVAVEINIWRNYKSLVNQRFGDIDNLAKGILDAMKGVLWIDDKQVVKLTVTKNLGAPLIELSVEEFKNVD